MCSGVEIAALAGLALSAAGTGTAIAGQQQQKAAMDAAVRNQISQQQSLQKKASVAYNQNVEASKPRNVQQQIDSGALNAKSLYNQLQQIPLTASEAVDPNNEVVNSDRSSRYASLIGGPASQMQGLNQYGVQEWIRNLQTNARLGAINNQSQLAASALQSQLMTGAGGGLQGVGSLMQTAGGLLGTYGGVNGAFSSPAQTAPTANQSLALRSGQGPLNQQSANMWANPNLNSILGYR